MGSQHVAAFQMTDRVQDGLERAMSSGRRGLGEGRRGGGDQGRGSRRGTHRQWRGGQRRRIRAALSHIHWKKTNILNINKSEYDRRRDQTCHLSHQDGALLHCAKGASRQTAEEVWQAFAVKNMTISQKW